MAETPRSLNRFAVPIKSLTHRFAFVGLIVFAFGLLILGKAQPELMDALRARVTDAFVPILAPLTRPVETASNIAAAVDELTHLHEENARLREERDRLLRWQAVARTLEAENKSLRGLLNFTPGPESSFISARVIGDTGGAFAHSLILSAGYAEGVRKGQAAVTGDGLVGRVTSVGGRSARILLVTDLNSRIPVILENTRTRGILAGNNTDRPLLIHLPPRSRVAPGERVVTSGHGGAFPHGLPVGIVASVTEGGIEVQPFVSRQQLEHVRVVDYGLKGILGPHRPQAAEKAASVVAPGAGSAKGAQGTPEGGAPTEGTGN